MTSEPCSRPDVPISSPASRREASGPCGGRASTAVTSNISLSEWGRYLGDATLTAPILDRLAMHAIRIDVDGPSYRQHIAKSRAEQRAAKA